MESAGRITKDTSARKNTKTDKMREDIEMRADKASQKAYLDTIIEGFETKIEEMEKVHAAEKEKLMATASSREKMVLEKQHAAVNEAVRAALASKEGQMADLKALLERSRGELSSFKATLDEALEEKKDAIRKIENEKGNLVLQRDADEQRHKQEIGRLQRKLEVGPNSWVEVTYTCKGRVPKTGVHRLSARFIDAVHDVCKEKGLKASTTTWFHGGKEITELNKTLSQVCRGSNAVPMCLVTTNVRAAGHQNPSRDLISEMRSATVSR